MNLYTVVDMPATKSLAKAVKAKKASPTPTARQLTTEPGTPLIWSKYYGMMVVNLAWYDWIFANSSAGKDSQAMLDFLVDLAIEQDCLHKLIVLHCDLGRIEWEGTKELAERQAKHYGLRFEAVRNGSHADLLARIAKRGQFPGRTSRYCTSEFKTGQARTLATRLVTESRLPKVIDDRGTIDPGIQGREVRILNCLGLRAEESTERANKEAYKHHPHYQLDKQGERQDGNGWTNSKRWTDEWLPIQDWTEKDVWARIKASGVEHHSAYDKGMPRLSCVLCPLASLSANVLGAFYNPDLADEYLALEVKFMAVSPRGKYSDRFTMAQVVALKDKLVAEADAKAIKVENWAA
jgi:3'-phosphoadenosine 5'-phosphosulfate sulfotransferase (PAPS reductase)/FAD synthetase